MLRSDKSRLYRNFKYQSGAYTREKLVIFNIRHRHPPLFYVDGFAGEKVISNVASPPP